MTDEHITEVQFRVFEGEVIAIFPYIVESYGTVLSYQHIGQHGECSMSLPTTKAKPEQYEALQRELEDLGYNLKVVQRRNYDKWYKEYLKFISKRKQ